jgi:hypothetical protein
MEIDSKSLLEVDGETSVEEIEERVYERGWDCDKSKVEDS